MKLLRKTPTHNANEITTISKTTDEEEEEEKEGADARMLTPTTTKTTKTDFRTKQNMSMRDTIIRGELEASDLRVQQNQYSKWFNTATTNNNSVTEHEDPHRYHDDSFVVATRISNPEFPKSSFASFSENENVVARRRRQQEQEQEQLRRRQKNMYYIETEPTREKRRESFEPQHLEDIQGTLPSQNGIAPHMVCRCDEASQYVIIKPDEKGKWEGEGGMKQYATRCPVHFPFAWTWKGDVHTGPLKGEAWMSAARLRDQRAKVVEFETKELERRRLKLRNIYDEENKHHPMSYTNSSKSSSNNNDDFANEGKVVVAEVEGGKNSLEVVEASMFSKVVNALESFGHNLFGDVDDDLKDDEDAGRYDFKKNNKNAMIVEDVKYKKEFAQFARDERALNFLDRSSTKKNPSGVGSSKEWVGKSQDSVKFAYTEGEPGYVVYETNFNYYIITHDASLSNWIYAKLDRTNSQMKVQEGGRKMTEFQINAFMKDVIKTEGNMKKLSSGAGLVIFIEFAEQDDGLTVDSIEVESEMTNPEHIIFRDEMKFRDKMRRSREFNLNYLHIERVYPDTWGANGAQFGVKNDYVVFSGVDCVRIPSKENAENAALVNMHRTSDASDFAEDARLKAKDREDSFKSRLVLTGGEIIERKSGSGSNQKWIFKGGRRLRKIANSKPLPPPSYANKEFRSGDGSVLLNSKKPDPPPSESIEIFLGSLEQSLFGKEIVNELVVISDDDGDSILPSSSLVEWEGAPIGCRILPDFAAHSYIRPGHVRRLKRMNLQIYRTKLLSETESIANFFVPLLETILKVAYNDPLVVDEVGEGQQQQQRQQHQHTDFIQKLLYSSDSRIPPGTRLVKLRFRNYSRHQGQPRRV